MPFKKIPHKSNYGYGKCDKNFKKWVKCMYKQKKSNHHCLNKYKLFYFCRKKINYPT